MIKNCHFCKAPAAVKERGEGDFTVACTGCGCELCLPRKLATEAEAVEEWNRRQGQAGPEAAK